MRGRGGQDGFTLVELLVAMTIGLLITGSATALLASSTRRSDDVQRRVDATQRAQVALDAMTRELRSQTCLRSVTPPLAPVLAGSTSTDVTFYMDFSATGDQVQRRRLSLDTASGVLTEQWWATPTSTGAATRTRRLATGIAAPADGVVFRYFAFNTSTGAPDRALAVPLTATTAPTVARIEVSLQGRPTGTRQDGTRVTPLTDEVFVRLTDPDGSPVPVCA